MSADKFVDLQGITKKYGEKTVLDKLDMHIGEGELLALLGPSGCGKSTSLRILSGLEKPTYGTVVIDGDDVTKKDVRKRGIGIVFQSYSLFPHMTATENVAYGMTLRGVKGDKRTQRAQELLEMVGLSEHMNKLPGQMSGGQQQRVALARALAVEPRVLLLDEPLSALDAKVRTYLREEIRNIQQRSGITTLMVTHDQEEALTMADRVGVMRAGKLEQVGTPGELYGSPETPFISHFVGVVNKVPGVVMNGHINVFNSKVRVANRDAVANGPAEALLRPEDLVLVPSPTGVGRVVSHVLRGPMSSVLVDSPGAKEPLRVDLSSPDAVKFAIGDTVDVHLDRHAAVVQEAGAEQSLAAV